MKIDGIEHVLIDSNIVVDPKALVGRSLADVTVGQIVTAAATPGATKRRPMREGEPAQTDMYIPIMEDNDGVEFI